MKVALFLANGFELVEATIPYDVLKRGEMDVSFVSIEGTKEVVSASENTVLADALLEEVDLKSFDLLITPGGMPGSERLRKDERVLEAIKAQLDDDKWVASICASPIVLDKAGVLEEKDFTCYPGFEKRIKNGNHKQDYVVQDGKLITAKGPGVAFEFAFKIVEELLGEDKMAKLKKDMLF